MNKIYMAWVCILVTALLLPACETNTDPDCTKEEIFCVGLVTDGGKIDDQYLNQAAWEGAQEAQTQLGAIINYIETSNWKDYYKNISAFGDVGYDVIIAVGFSQTDATVLAAKQYPDLFFIGVDQTAPEILLPNLAVLTFQPEQAGFLAGVLAALMTKTKKVQGVMASIENPYIWRLSEGYIVGVTYTNPDVEVGVSNHSDASPEESLSDPEWGSERARAAIKMGADIVFAAGGETGDSALVAAVEGGALAIGVDVDKFSTLPEAQKGLLTCIIKRITPEVFSLIKTLKDGKERPSGIISGQMEYTPFHLLDSAVSDEIRTKIKEIQAGLIEGSIEINIRTPEPTAIPES